ncbi:hypothetical protein O3G_MSEX005571 [Manduca sexta]|uniref:N(6)-L-threonylcarbamoyladenine synthase n=1 Tax=Manduca sexta TaxID=7130 RepID=A0A922CJM7_MANSE|nr:hypothetical protein O3G_MSEX005571 [Manduca sexta]
MTIKGPRIFTNFIHILSKRRISSTENVCATRLYTSKILGIETSCDDTGCAIIDDSGRVLSDVLHSQNLIHLRNGGIIPDIAQDLHRTYIGPTVSKTLQQACLSMEDISAVAVTLKPGLPLSLAVGMKYAKHLARQYDKPIIPIHHMEAHALVARMEHDIVFPFLVLLISGGHCLLAIVKDVNNIQLLGESRDSAPGEVFDKVARRLKLKNIPEYSKLCGGEAIERAAMKSTDHSMFKLPLPLTDHKDCNFSFNGLKTSVLYHIHKKEKEHNIVADKLIPEVNELCASMLNAITKHLIHRTQRAMEFCQRNKLIPDNNKQFIVSGGVACNNYIYNCLKTLCEETEYSIFRPNPKLCTDNGLMIAWNGLEKWKKGLDITKDYKSLDIEACSPLGTTLIEEVAKAKIPIKLMKIKV